MSSLDEQLRALEQQHNQQSPSEPDPTPEPPSELDQQLVAIASQFQSPPPPQPTPDRPVDDALTQTLQGLEQDQVSQQLQQSQNNQKIGQAITDVIETKRQRQHKVDPVKNARAIAAAEKQKQQAQKRIRAKAENWLNNLDPMSNEGLWFYDFATGYESPLAAAMDYLMALE